MARNSAKILCGGRHRFERSEKKQFQICSDVSIRQRDDKRCLNETSGNIRWGETVTLKLELCKAWKFYWSNEARTNL